MQPVTSIADIVAQDEQMSRARKLKEVRVERKEGEAGGYTERRKSSSSNTSNSSKNAPIRRSGEKAIDDGSFDKTNAVLGIVDHSKLTITLYMQTQDPDRPEEYIRGEKRTYTYLHQNPDFHDKKDIMTINKWRQQVFSRCLGRIGKSRVPWLKSEKQLVLDLVRQQFQRRSMVKWNKLANTYNEIQDGVMQGVGDDAAAIHLSARRWTEFVELETAAAKAKTSSDADDDDSSDEEEKPDPNDGPVSSRPTTQSQRDRSSNSAISRKRNSRVFDSNDMDDAFDESVWDVPKSPADKALVPTRLSKKRKTASNSHTSPSSSVSIPKLSQPSSIVPRRSAPKLVLPASSNMRAARPGSFPVSHKADDVEANVYYDSDGVKLEGETVVVEVIDEAELARRSIARRASHLSRR
ncbi:uncharacterized protein LY89DRAFT_735944 [Mollisia scopiformis]|uniref:Uncharacterized protein n=1 Tax=Mollisia scopiformis TaxID=149040 RepID=A0A194X3W6_MOLSC|nr:uncharacterized protein LY89DRAFT_735944 [Mollisia scopiformis]KUJ14883.1 hypothetical protein LY89DRAFT_735944 [Mollisia scopiformis]